MPSPAFVAGDFKVFDVKRGSKAARMDEIRARVRPKLDAFGGSLAPSIQPLGRRRCFRARREARAAYREPARRHLGRVRPTRAATRSIVISRWPCRGATCASCSRSAPSTRQAALGGGRAEECAELAPVLRRVKHLAWFKNEHDEEPAAPLADLTPETLAELAERADADPRRAAGRGARRAGRGGRALDGGAVPLRSARNLPRAGAPLFACASLGTRAVIFDMDGVLVDSNAHHRARGSLCWTSWAWRRASRSTGG